MGTLFFMLKGFRFVIIVGFKTIYLFELGDNCNNLSDNCDNSGDKI